MGALDKIPRLQWMDYLRWYRDVLALPVRNGHRVTTSSRAATASSSSASRATAGRRAPGRAGRPRHRPRRPRRAVAARVRRRIAAHALGALVDDNDYAALAGPARRRRRRRRLGDGQRRDRARGRRSAGAPAGAAKRPAAHQQGQGRRQSRLRRRLRALADAWKWRIRHYINTQQVPPPRNSTQRVSRHANAHFHLGVAIEASRARGALQVRTSAGPIELDFLIFATGFKVDWRQRPMLRRIAPCIRVWKDRYAPPPGDEDAELAESPDLGAGVRVPGARRRRLPRPRPRPLPQLPGDALARRHHRRHPGDQRRRAAARRQAGGAALREDIDHHFARMQAYAEPEILGDEWVAEPLPTRALRPRRDDREPATPPRTQRHDLA
jgi:cation diffusion facilitator CzcD-associated flavoprotein CzcO